MSLVISSTPWESYEIDGIPIWVKREDLSCPHPGPSFSKIRGIEKVIQSQLRGVCPPEAVGVVDTVHSKAGWGVSYICYALGVPCWVFYPLKKSDDIASPRVFQRMAKSFGAEIIPLPATKSSVLFYQARKIFYAHYPLGFMMPNGLQLYDTILQTSREVSLSPPDLLCGSWVVSVSSGTIGCGVVMGLSQLGFGGKLFFHFGFSRSEEVMKQKVKKYGNVNVVMIDEGYQYADAVKFPCPFPCNPYYDRKAWKWLVKNIKDLEPPVIFWNIGA